MGACLLLLGGGDDTGLSRAIDPYQVEVVQTTADLSQHLTSLPDLEFGGAPTGGGPVITVDARTRYQTVHGFGAAMTDTSAWLIERKLPAAARQTLMSELFGSSGIRLDFVKVPMGGSDFTNDGRPYTYDDLPPGRKDPALTHFSIAHDRPYILPALRQARALTPSATFMATPWTPPAWMKTNRSLGNAGDRGMLLGADYGALAEYFVKFIRAYTGAGIPISAVSPQNEPGTATLYPGMNFSPVSEARWISGFLKPALAKARLHPKIYGGDVGWDGTAYTREAVRQSARNGLAGLAWHCYYGAPDVMNPFHEDDPDLDEIVDECSPGLSPTPVGEIVIGALRNWASTVALWNLALDPTGGPVEPPNHGCPGCMGLATIDPKQGTAALDTSYYAVGQASAFISPGARRIASGHFVTYKYPRPGVNVVTPGLDDVALRNPNGSIVLVAYANSAFPIRFQVAWRDRAFTYQLPPGATVTFVWNRA